MYIVTSGFDKHNDELVLEQSDAQIHRALRGKLHANVTDLRGNHPDLQNFFIAIRNLLS